MEAEEQVELQNSITVTGKKRSADKTTEITYSYKVYFDSENELKALADVKLAEKLIAERVAEKKEPNNKGENPHGIIVP